MFLYRNHPIFYCQKNVAVIGRDDTGAPKFGLMAEMDTNEPNGVKVSIPTYETEVFRSAARDNFFIGWKPGSITIDGQAPSVSVFNTDKYVPLDEFGFKRAQPLNNRYNYDQSVALIDAVRYTINWNNVPGVSSKLVNGFLKDTIIRLDNGSVKLVPSREDLEYNKMTREAILKRVTELVEIGKKDFVDAIQNASSRMEALKLTKKATDYGFDGNYQWKGEKVVAEAPSDIALSLGTYVTFGQTYDHKVFKERNSYTLQRFMMGIFTNLFIEQSYGPSKHVVLVHSNGDPADLKPKHTWQEETIHAETKNSNVWAMDYAEKNSISISEIKMLFITEDATKLSKWVTEPFTRVLSATEYLDEITDIRKAKAKARRDAAGPRPKLEDSSVRFLQVSRDGSSVDREVPLSSLDKTLTYVLLQNGVSDFDDSARKVLTARTAYYDSKQFADIIYYALAESGAKILVANKGVKTSHYAASLPNMIGMKDLIEKTAKDILNKLTDVEISARIDRQDRNVQWARTLNVSTDLIENEETRAWIVAMSSSVHKIPELITALIDFNGKRGLVFDGSRITKAESAEPLGYRYPLLHGRHGRLGEDEVEYINLLDAKRKAAAEAAAQEEELPLADESAA